MKGIVTFSEASFVKKEMLLKKRKEERLGSLEEKQGGRALMKQHSATKQPSRTSNMKRFYSLREIKARNIKYSWVSGVGSEKSFLHPLWPGDQGKGGNEMALSVDIQGGKQC